MADDQDESQQTEQPTASGWNRRAKQGDIVKSTEVTAFMLLAGGTLALAMFGKYTMLGLARALSLFWNSPTR